MPTGILKVTVGKYIACGTRTIRLDAIDKHPNSRFHRPQQRQQQPGQPGRKFEAKKLKGEDFLGKNDNFVVLYVNPAQKFQTSVKYNTGAQATWNEHFNIPVNGEEELHIYVMDKDTFKDDEVGKAKYNLKEIASTTQGIDLWIKLPAFLFMSDGEVRLRLQFLKQ
ncbi:C2 domain-containing protein [Polychytrium aggregatum]|uniref:C2 domain-containing protein n=1 Tax=Polychytrium aggregatum TaxID=110093 RepID=UPI0022FDF004|nr:C2 domain-containing protein [Polychytrium aggregatum]KAI9202761.1 C2 domain-containing protein [Polychytrium aggregatum]